MIRQHILLGRIMGIPIGVDYSWFLVFALLTWSLATGYYPAEFPAWSPPLAAVLAHGRRDGHHALCERAAA
ncbi:MAG: hypothetical protein HY234_09385 [Acidobacteria bacterium]|nr:hypothetical protein [Acidobacteriota bacterium]